MASTASPLLAGRETVGNVAYVVITADRGLCGGYNAGVQRAAEGEIKADVLQGRDYSVIAVGRKAESYFRFRGYKIKDKFAGFSDAPSYADAREIGQRVVDLFVNGEVDRVELIYTRFISAGSQEVVQRPLVPLERDTVAGGDGTVAGARLPTSSTSPIPPPSSTPCCRSTSRPVSTQRCSTRRPASMRSVNEP